MMGSRTFSRDYVLRVRADFAYFGLGPTTGPNRCSSYFPSHAASDGIARKVLGKREIQWVALQATMLAMPRKLTVTTNDLLSFDTKSFIPGTNIVPPLVHNDKNHTQRTTVYLRNADYAIRMYMVLTKHAGPEDTIRKFEEMFERRAARGQCFDANPSMGVSECPARYELVDDVSKLPPPVDFTQDFGLQFFDRDWTQPGGPMYYAPMSCEHGVVNYPTWDEVRALGIKREVRRSS